jgi:hypothetical protein
VETHLHIDPKDVQTFLKEYDKDPHFREILGSFPEEAPFVFKSYHQNHDGLIFFGDHSGRHRLGVPKSMRMDIMDEMHGSLTGTAHGGFERTYGRIANGFYWPGMTRDI